MRWPELLLVAVVGCGVARGQRPIGRVALEDATVTGTLVVEGGKATLSGGASIVAKDHTAELALERGGTVKVCATSSLHVTSGADAGAMTPLLFALDRGAIEVKMTVGTRDILITPDLRLSTPSGGPLDLRVRVTSNGDTCVENRGAGGPTVEVVEQFGDGHYLVPGGQHVLFERGNVREVVDRESSPCGCPPVPVMSLAESGVTVAPGKAARAGGQAAQAVEPHPFPAAQSQGLAPTGVAQVPQAGAVHAQVAATMAYGGDKDSTTTTEAQAAGSGAPAAAAPELGRPGGGAGGGTARSGSGGTSGPGAVSGSAGTASPAAAPVAVAAPPPPAPPGARDIGHRIGRFFKRLFGAG